ncbi:MAG: DUF2341 domain-containing protein [Candidatus Aenigmarchaeota archaeon]|nr:DUF2341 domain-containing protein [Candidatus Aenigmarchaeota archaeon]
MDFNINMTFDYPFPPAENATQLTAEVWRNGEMLQSKTLTLSKFLEKYKIASNGKYAFRPIYFNFSVFVEAKNVSYSPTTFTYGVRQSRRTPYENEDDKKWKVSGRIVQGTQYGFDIYNNYCSGPWDFNEQAWPVSRGYMCYRQAGDEECRKGGVSAIECKATYGSTGTAPCALCCSPRCQLSNTDCVCMKSGLNEDCDTENMPCTKFQQNPQQHWVTVQSTCCVEQEILGYTCSASINGICLKNNEAGSHEETIEISRGTWDEVSGETSWTAPVQKGAVLYFEVGDSRNVPNDPIASPAVPNMKWSSAHSWKFETYVIPTQSVNGKVLRVYPDDGMRYFFYKLDANNNWVPASTQNWSCVTGQFDNTVLADGKTPTKINGCPISLYMNKNSWYKLEFYLYNDPWGRSEGGGESSDSENPLGLRIEDYQTKSASLLDILGTGSIMSSEPPGDDGAVIGGSATVFANEGLKEIRDFKMFATTHSVDSCSSGVDCSMRAACGNSDYNGVKTNKYGWILNHAIYPFEWSDVGGVSTTKAGYITSTGKNGGEKMAIDAPSITPVNGYGRYKYTNMWFDDNTRHYIGGIYKCAKEWPSWAADCPEENNRYSYARGSDQIKCCYVSSTVTGTDQKVTIEYDTRYQYIINFLPGAGDKLCVASEYNAGSGAAMQTVYQSNYTNALCDTKTGSRCCYCRPGWGCKMDCSNELNMTASSKFALPFPAIGPFWEIKNARIRFEATEPPVVINLTSEGNAQDGWDIKANLGDRATLMLDKNYTIPLNLYNDFGLKAPDEMLTGARDTLRLSLNTSTTLSGFYIPFCRMENGNTRISCDYTFHTVDCTKEGVRSSYYDEETYPATKGKGACKAGVRTCVKLGENNLRWVYDTTNDMPVYPAPETCNGKDDDCNGLVDDVKTFDMIINEIISAGGKKNPYQVTKCACFMGAASSDERCNNIDDDCNGVVDDSSVTMWSNTCDSAVKQCVKEGSPYEWCKSLYNSTQCSLTQTQITVTGNVTVNTCTEKMRACMDNAHVLPSGTQVKFTYEECKQFYNNYSCFFNEKKIVALGDTCRCTLSNPQPETCNGVDDDCNNIIDDVENATTCGCAFLMNTSLVANLKASGDVSCDGIDSDCNGAIDDGAKNCACTGRPAIDVVEIKGKVKEMCDGIDNDCNGLTDEAFPQVGKPCGYGLCSGGIYVCGVHGDKAVCNTTVNPDETFNGKAIKLNYAETCDLRDNDCDYSIDEDCSCTPESAVKLCGYQSGIYYKDKTQLTQTCNQAMTELKKLITWAEAPENVKYRRMLTVRNNENVALENYPINFSLNTFMLNQTKKMRPDGGDLRILPADGEKNLDWNNSNPFVRAQTTIWFKASLPANQEKKFYVYYGNPTATYKPVTLSEVTGLTYGIGVFLLCHFEGTTACEGNMVPRYDNGVTFQSAQRELLGEVVDTQGAFINGFDKLTYPTSENFNKNRGTVMMWFYPEDVTEDHYLFYSTDLSGNPQFGLHFNENGTFFEAYDKLGNARRINGGIVNIGWHHIAVTWDNLKGTKIYMDGALRNSTSASWEANDIGVDVYVGGDGTSKTAYSLIDELAVYSQELDQASIREKMRYYKPYVTMGPEETLNETVATTETDVYEKCTVMLQNISADEAKKATILSLCDTVRICSKTDFPINSISECTFGVQTCASGQWAACTAVQPKTEVCNLKDDDCNGLIDDVAVPETCACSNGGEPGIELCNGIDDDCNGKIDDVRGMDTAFSTHCGCYDQIVNITQKNSEKETLCNAIDDNCDGTIDEGIEKCACAGTSFNSALNSVGPAVGEEKCDDVDNDCNMVIDDPWIQGGTSATKFDYLGAPCSPLSSRCVGGVFVCSKTATDMVCSTSSGDGIKGQDLRTNETCNLLDDDCNGKIDDIWGDISGKFCRCYNGVPRANETCNGIDDDCNGLIDDGLGNCGCAFDIEDNVNNINQLSILISAKKAGGETCNNIDDDCNGAVDDGLGSECFCSGGFAGNAATKPEFCNGFDDDCNGVIDDVTYPETCACYNGTVKAGKQAEICDGIDNDCNGLVDEDWPMLGSMCGVGACSNGVYECLPSGTGTACSTMEGGSDDKSKDEECGNNIDDNCNAVTDENCICDVAGETRKCSSNVGECREGVQTCSADKEWSGCIGGVLPAIETCNGKDDDCSGAIDDLSGGKCGCYGGASPKTESCNGIDDDCNGAIDDVSGKSSVEATQCGCYDNAYAKGAKPEACNRIDDDCDEIIDNVKDGTSVESARCACYNNGYAGVESCNGIDDDCDEATDEDWPNVGQDCGQGICTSTFVCSPDGKTLSCNGAMPQTEVCDGKDNNCNGLVDEGCFGSEVGSCENMVQDSNEEGIDCGGVCPVACSAQQIINPASGSWMIVFAALVVVIVAVGIVLVFMKPGASV